MPKRNRVTPYGDIVAIDLRGAWLGNRGILHEGEEIVAFHRHRLWITCALQHRDWRLPQWQPHHFTVLFFHDEAVSLAAGHRPCALCRRADYNAYRGAWATATGEDAPLATEMDRVLHGERLHPGTHRRRLHDLPWASLPAGAFAVVDDLPVLVRDDAVVPWTHAGYGVPRARPRRGSGDGADAAVDRGGAARGLPPAGRRRGRVTVQDRNSTIRRCATLASGIGSSG